MYNENMQVKIIECPNCEAPDAELYCHGHEYAGTWFCETCETGDVHEHDNYEVETVTTDYMRNGEPDQYDSEIYVCGGENGCGEMIEDVSPAQERAEALAEMAQDCE
jgi:hypothetical protein